MGTLKTTNIQTITGSGTLTLGTSGETVSFASGVTGLNYPAFEANLGSKQTVSDNTATKVEIDNETFDTDSMYDATTNYRWLPTVAGKYYVYASVLFDTDEATNSKIDTVDVYIYKNGSIYAQSKDHFLSNPVRMAYLETSAVIDFNGSSDYIELYARNNVNGGTPIFEPNTSWKRGTKFGAYRIGT
tara:strand:- start:21 stop:581 length:561 start_codon:yes stop_codon:yes gene_type:complete